jgi:Restriction endonuclease BglII
MQYNWPPHRFADIILNSDYALKQEIEQVIQSIFFEDVLLRYTQENERRRTSGCKEAQGKQSIINAIFRKEFAKFGWEIEKNVFSDPINDLTIDFWKRKVGIDVAFNHRSFIGGDLLRLQAAAEVKNVINVGVYICPTKEFARVVSPRDASSMVSYERTKWYFENFYPVLTAPILLVGLTG